VTRRKSSNAGRIDWHNHRLVEILGDPEQAEIAIALRGEVR